MICIEKALNLFIAYNPVVWVVVMPECISLVSFAKHKCLQICRQKCAEVCNLTSIGRVLEASVME